MVARELTKQFEEIVRATPSEHLSRLASAPIRGEFTLVIPAPARGSVSGQTETLPGVQKS